MKVLNLTKKAGIYTSNAYLLTGEHNQIGDINTLIDTGRDPKIFAKLELASTGVGKRKVERIILTHSHYDHASLANEFKKRYKSVVYGYSTGFNGIDEELKDRKYLRVADTYCQIIHSPFHSSDSITVYFPNEKVAFIGDVDVVVRNNADTKIKGYVEYIEFLRNKNIKVFYPGHGDLIENFENKIIKKSLKILEGGNDNELV